MVGSRWWLAVALVGLAASVFVLVVASGGLRSGHAPAAHAETEASGGAEAGAPAGIVEAVGGTEGGRGSLRDGGAGGGAVGVAAREVARIDWGKKFSVAQRERGSVVADLAAAEGHVTAVGIGPRGELLVGTE